MSKRKRRPRPEEPTFHEEQLPTSQLYWMLRPATDAAIDRYLQEKANPIAAMQRKLAAAFKTDELAEKLAAATAEGAWTEEGEQE